MNNHKFESCLWSLYLLLFLIIPANAQLQVVATSPGHGTTAVDTATTIMIEFNEAIDTTARFQFPGDFVLGLRFFPDSLVNEPDTFYFSPDLKKVYFQNLHLSPDETYWFLINEARSLAGDSLQQPYSMVFSTGAAIPSAQVSGTIQNLGGSPAGSIVFLFDRNPMQSEGDFKIVNAGVVQPGQSDYQIDYVTPGTYWVFAGQKIYFDDESEIQFYPGARLGYYDPNNDFIPDSIIVSSGSTISNISFSTGTVNNIDALAAYQTALVGVHSWAADAGLVRLSGEPDYTGLSDFWNFLFYSNALNEFQLWASIGGVLIRSDFFEALPDTVLTPPGWINSDSLLMITEAAGGEQFRQNNDNVDIECALSFQPYFSFGDGKIEPLNHYKPGNINPPESASGIGLNLWMVSYDADTAGIFFLIDPFSAEILNTRTTAAPIISNAEMVAMAWASDAHLYTLEAYIDGLGPDGKANFWNVIFYSESLLEYRSVFMWGKIPIGDQPPPFVPNDLDSLPSGWLDSDVTIAVAENGGGAAYRAANQDVWVQGVLEKRTLGPHAGLTLWRFEYLSSNAASEVYLVDALTGLLVGIEPDDPQIVQTFSLDQNYPNPFNPATTIRFALPEPSDVLLEIYNIAGQKVKVLVDNRLPIGEHLVVWNGQDVKGRPVASGIYFYRLTAGNLCFVKKMMLMK